MSSKNKTKTGKARFESGRTYGKQARSDDVIRVSPRKDGKGTEISSMVSFPIDDKSEQKAADYASEMQRETRGFKSGGKVRGCGAATRGLTKGKMR